MQAEVARELLHVELAGLPRPILVGDLQVVENLAVDILDIVQRRRADADNLAQPRLVRRIPEQHRPGRLAVASGPARLLEVGLDALRHVVVADKAHVGLVDAHTEGVGGDNHARLAALPAVLDGAARLPLHPGVVGLRGDPVAAQEGRQVGRRLAPPHVDDAASLDLAANLQQYAELVLRLPEHIIQVGPHEGGADQVGRAEGQLLLDIFRHLRGGRSGQGNHRHAAPDLLAKLRNPQIIRPKVVSPLRDAVRLVHHQEADIHLLQAGLEDRGVQALGRHVEELVVTVDSVVQRDVDLPRRHARIDRQRLDAAPGEVLHLVFHQRNQGRNDNRNPLPHQRRHLETEALAPARGQDGQRVPARQRRRNNLLLLGPEGVVPPISFQCLEHLLQKYEI